MSAVACKQIMDHTHECSLGRMIYLGERLCVCVTRGRGWMERKETEAIHIQQIKTKIGFVSQEYVQTFGQNNKNPHNLSPLSTLWHFCLRATCFHKHTKHQINTFTVVFNREFSVVSKLSVVHLPKGRRKWEIIKFSSHTRFMRPHPTPPSSTLAPVVVTDQQWTLQAAGIMYYRTQYIIISELFFFYIKFVFLTCIEVWISL